MPLLVPCGRAWGAHARACRSEIRDHLGAPDASCVRAKDRESRTPTGESSHACNLPLRGREATPDPDLTPSAWDSPIPTAGSEHGA